MTSMAKKSPNDFTFGGVSKDKTANSTSNEMTFGKKKTSQATESKATGVVRKKLTKSTSVSKHSKSKGHSCGLGYLEEALQEKEFYPSKALRKTNNELKKTIG